MEHFIERVRNAFRRTANRVTGRHVPVVASGPPAEDLENRLVRIPAADIIENDHEVVVIADTPGAFSDNTRLHFDDQVGLSIHVRLPDEATAPPLWGEGIEGDWYRTFSLPDYVDGYEATAAVRSGVLTIHIPKQTRPAPVTIPVTAS